jgi:prepilin-type processing-associated H-X9-DG protein
MPIPIDPRKKPADVKVRVSTGAGVDILWADGHSSHYDFAYLREQCPCAMCDDARRKKEDVAAHAASGPGIGASAVLPMFKPRPTARAAKAVGNYALQIDFSDGHTTGIYSYDYLRTICPCEACAEAFRAQAS